MQLSVGGEVERTKDILEDVRKIAILSMNIFIQNELFVGKFCYYSSPLSESTFSFFKVKRLLEKSGTIHRQQLQHAKK